MQCTHPIYLPDQDQEVACGYCIPCLHNARRDWCVRMWFEAKDSEAAYFVTLTYNDWNLPRDENSGFATLQKSDVQEFLQKVKKKCRKSYRENGKVKTRYYTPRWFVIGEYGPTTERPHYHALMFLSDLENQNIQDIASCWQKGFVRFDQVTDARINYCAKYQFAAYQEDVKNERAKPFRVVTKKSGGIGRSYLNEENKRYQVDRIDGSIHAMGKWFPLPGYYRRRIGYTPDQLAELWRKKEAEFESRFDQTYQALRRQGIAEPLVELKYREEMRIGKILKTLTKGRKV